VNDKSKRDAIGTDVTLGTEQVLEAPISTPESHTQGSTADSDSNRAQAEAGVGGNRTENQPRPRIRDRFDRVGSGLACGWAYVPEYPNVRLQVAILIQDQIIAQGIANRFQQDLLDAGIGDGAHAFELQIEPEQLRRVQPSLSGRVIKPEARPLGSPFTPAPKHQREANAAVEQRQEHSMRQGQDQAQARAPEQAPEHLADVGTKQGQSASTPTGAATAKLRADNPPQPPFENTRDTRFFFPSAKHAKALSRLFLLTHDRNLSIGVLTGEIGAGKTLLCSLLYARLNVRDYLRVSIENSLLDIDGLLLEILSQMQGERLAASDFPDRYTRLAAFKRFLSEQVVSRNRHLVILVDEAQQLSTETIEGLKALTNISSEQQNFLSLILIGQPELRAKLKQLPQVDQRVSLRFHLEGLDRAETGYYVRHRLRAAGFRGEPPVTEEALDLIHQTTRGIPREINRLCKLALDYLLTHNGGEFDEQTIAIVVDDLRQNGVLQ
jgi:general secretion pathway protein A